MKDHPESDLPRMSELGVSDTERDVLTLVRLHCTSYERDEVRGLDAALSFAEGQFGPDAGPLIAVRLVALVRALRTERQARFCYLSPACPSCSERITLHEWQLVLLLRAAKYRDAETTAQTAASLAGSH